jgi:hypothetical protein
MALQRKLEIMITCWKVRYWWKKKPGWLTYGWKRRVPGGAVFMSEKIDKINEVLKWSTNMTL